MKHLFPKTVFILGSLVVIFSLNLAGQAINLSKSDTIVCDTFPPPRNLDGLSFDQTVLIWWELPILIDSLGADTFLLENLVCFKIIRNGIILDTVYYSGEDTIRFYDTPIPGPWDINYYVSAIYDLENCGLPGEYGESEFVGAITFGSISSLFLPFVEDWNTGSFDPNLWTADEYWEVDVSNGNPYPSAKFSYYIDTAYTQELISYWLDCLNYPGTNDPYVNGDFYLEFDIKLDDYICGWPKHMEVFISDSLDWVLVEQFPNYSGGFDWTSSSINITEWAKGKMVRIKFSSSQDQGLNIEDWFIDNIRVSRVCNPPLNLHWISYQEHMAWSPPLPHTTKDKHNQEKELLGYKVYYDQTLIGSTYDTFFILDSPYWANYYYVTAVYEDCEPASNYLFGPANLGEDEKNPQISIYPNPCNDKLTIESEQGLHEINFINAKGETVLKEECQTKKVFLNTRSIPNGLYFIKIKLADAIYTKKVIISH